MKPVAFFLAVLLCCGMIACKKNTPAPAPTPPVDYRAQYVGIYNYEGDWKTVYHPSGAPNLAHTDSGHYSGQLTVSYQPGDSASAWMGSITLPAIRIDFIDSNVVDQLVGVDSTANLAQDIPQHGFGYITADSIIFTHYYSGASIDKRTSIRGVKVP